MFALDFYLDFFFNSRFVLLFYQDEIGFFFILCFFNQFFWSCFRALFFIRRIFLLLFSNSDKFYFNPLKLFFLSHSHLFEFFVGFNII